MNKRKSFLIHIDSLDILDDLTNEQCGELFKAIKSYQQNEEITLSAIAKIAFSPFKNQFKRDFEKYQITCERRALAGSMGGKQKVANASKCKQEVANVADNKNKNKNKNKNIKDLSLVVPKFNFKNELLSLGVDEDTLDDWLIVRKKKRASDTRTALKTLLTEISKSGLTINEAVEMAASCSWSGFKAEWAINQKGNNHGQRDEAKFETTVDRYARQSRELQAREAQASQHQQNSAPICIDGEVIRS